jgi:hypothetical protein
MLATYDTYTTFLPIVVFHKRVILMKTAGKDISGEEKA